MNFSEALFKLLPAIYQVKDQRESATLIDGKGQLERFLEIFGVVLKGIKERNDNLLDLFKVDKCPYKFLPYLAALVGVKFNYDLPEERARREIAYAVKIYKRKGTKEGLEFLVSNLLNQNATIVPFIERIFFANREDCYTPDMNNLEEIGRMGTGFDTLSYVYDTENVEDTWYSRERIGLFIEDWMAVSEKFLNKLKRIVKDYTPVGSVVVYTNFKNWIELITNTEGYITNSLSYRTFRNY